MKVAFVTPRYGLEVMGGAESAARQLAEHLVAECRWQVEVFSTCALDHITWDNVLPAGDSKLNGVTVHRFASSAGRVPEFYELDARLRMAPAEAGLEQARRWVELNGPVTPDLVDALRESDADVVAFYPYLYYPTVEGMDAVSVPAGPAPGRPRRARVLPRGLRRHLQRGRRHLLPHRGRTPARATPPSGGADPPDRAGPGRLPRRRGRAAGCGDPGHRGSALRRERGPGRRAQGLGDAGPASSAPTSNATPGPWPWRWSGRWRRRSPSTRTSSSPARSARPTSGTSCATPWSRSPPRRWSRSPWWSSRPGSDRCR